MAGRKQTNLYRLKNPVSIRKSQRIRNQRRILIVCEGQETEPNYFRAFPANPEVYDKLDVVGTGYNTLSLVKKAVELKNEAARQRAPYIDVWAVFDLDDFSVENFQKARDLAQKNQIKCAYSIESFELWYILHFQYLDAALSRTDYGKKLTERLGREYLKNDPNMYATLKSRLNTAMSNAKVLFEKQHHKPISEQNPITLVFKLVESLFGE